MSGKETMIKRIGTERGDTPAEEVVELNLDNCKSNGEPEGLDDSYTSLSKLSLINVGFTSLKNFPKLPQLSTLELSDNRIAGSLSCLKHCQKLTSLNLSGNHIKTIDALEPLADLTNLESLDLFNCDVTKADKYRDQVFKLLPGLKYLDSYDRDMNEKAESDDEDDEDENGKEEEEGDEENGEASKEGTNGAAADEDEEDDDFDSGDDDEESGSEEEEEIGLEYLIKGDAQDEDDEEDDDYQGEEEEEDDVEIPEEEEEDDVNTSGSRGVKRKHEDDDDE